MSDASSAFGWLRKRLAELRGAGVRDEPLLPRVAVVTDSAAALPEEVQQAFAAGALTRLKLSCTSGSVFAELPAVPGFSGEIRTVSGSVKSDLAMTRNGNFYTCGDGSVEISISSVSGSVTVSGWKD